MLDRLLGGLTRQVHEGADGCEEDEDAKADAGQLGAAAQERISQQQDGEDGPDHRQMVKQQV
jgi:hypothetical protein